MSDFSDDDFDAAPAPAPAPVADAAVLVPCAPSGDVAEHSWRIDVEVATIPQRKSSAWWISSWSGWGAAPPGIAPTHGDVAMALPGRPGSSAGGASGDDAVGGGAGLDRAGAFPSGQRRMVDGASEPMARRLARRTGMCVVCSVNVPLELADLALFAERQVVAKCELGLFES